MRFVIVLLLTGVIGALSGCAAPPTRQEIDSADYGEQISQADAEAKAKEVAFRSLRSRRSPRQ